MQNVANIEMNHMQSLLICCIHFCFDETSINLPTLKEDYSTFRLANKSNIMK